VANFRYTKIPARPEIIYKHIRARVVKELQVVGKSHKAERDEIVREWEHKPVFGYRTRITPKEIRVEVYLKNPGERVGDSWSIGQLWEALDRTGTRPHPIPRQPKPPGKYLRFKWGGPAATSQNLSRAGVSAGRARWSAAR